MYKVIIVDDDELIRKGLERVIRWERMGFVVNGTFQSGMDALEYVKSHPVDVILTDIRMPQMSGLDLIEAAKGYRRDVKAVIISGYGEFELVKQALVLKAEDYLLKPLGQEEVEAVFLKLKQSLDRERQVSSEEDKSSWKREKERRYLKEWKAVEALRKEMIVHLENGRIIQNDRQMKELDQILSSCKGEDTAQFYSHIITRLVEYFDLDHDGTLYWFAGSGKQEWDQQMDGEQQPERLKEQFWQDMDSIQKSLRNHSDHMRNLLTGKAKSMIEAEYGDESLSLASVANRLNISYGYLSTIFTKAEGHSFKAHLVMVRMEKARLLLLSRKYRIYEIAQMTGYKNPRYFTDAFKKYYHCSPADYIARFRGKEEM
ncbi:MAG: response regulator [Lachnospiraceae bacterium]|jgi:two-component system response regulator YesN|nr:response regulator [Lachnospiraceae bacterium]